MKRIITYLCGAIVLSGGTALFAQQGQKKNKPVARKDETRKDNLNRTDALNRKQGLWFFRHEAGMGEPLYYEYGNYANDRKTGLWTRLDAEQQLAATENYYLGVLNGTAHYYEDGRLTCIGNYRGMYANSKYDSIWVTHPETYEDTLVALPAETGSTRHGLWRYYDAKSGQLTREEEYQVDDLIYRREFQHYTHSDSSRIEQRNANLPHNRKERARPPAGKGRSLTGY